MRDYQRKQFFKTSDSENQGQVSHCLSVKHDLSYKRNTFSMLVKEGYGSIPISSTGYFCCWIIILQPSTSARPAHPADQSSA